MKLHGLTAVVLVRKWAYKMPEGLKISTSVFYKNMKLPRESAFVITKYHMIVGNQKPKEKTRNDGRKSVPLCCCDLRFLKDRSVK